MRAAMLLSALLTFINVGDRAPRAAVQTLAGRPADLGDYIGKTPVVLEFWGKWCPNCRELEPKVAAAHRTLGDKVTFVTVAVSVDETPAEVAAYAKAHGMAGTIVYDQTGAAVDAYDVPGTSFLVVIDRTGRVVYTGAGGDQDVVAAVKKAL